MTLATFLSSKNRPELYQPADLRKPLLSTHKAVFVHRWIPSNRSVYVVVIWYGSKPWYKGYEMTMPLLQKTFWRLGKFISLLHHQHRHVKAGNTKRLQMTSRMNISQTLCLRGSLVQCPIILRSCIKDYNYVKEIYIICIYCQALEHLELNSYFHGGR